MTRVLAVVVVALLVAGAGCWEDDDSPSGGRSLSATSTPAPGTWGALTYDQRHTVCSEAAEMFEEEANAHARPGYTWPTAKPTFYTKCIQCGGPTEVYGYITERIEVYGYISEEEKLHTGCLGLFGPVIPDGATQFWP